MVTAFRAFEYVVYVLAICMIAGGISGFYLKLFDMNPPAPYLVPQLPVMGAMAAVMVIRFRQVFFGLTAALPFVFLGALMAVSFKWSYFPGETLREGIVALFIILYLAMAAWRYDWKTLIDGMWTAMLGMVLFSCVLYVAMPDIARMSDIHAGSMSGIWIEKNAAGQAGAFGAITALGRLAIKPKSLMTSLPSFFLFTLFLLLSTSKTSLVAFLIGCMFFAWVFLMRRTIPVAMMTLWGSLFGGAATLVWLRSNTDVVFEALGRSSTFTGRADVWNAVQMSLDDRPLLGHGFAGYWQEEFEMGRTMAWTVEELKYFPNHAHNSFIEMGLNLGQVGMVTLAVGLILTAIATFSKIRTNHGAYFAVPFFMAALIVGSFESVLAYPGNFAGGIMVLCCAKMARPTLMSESRHTLLNFMRWFGGRIIAHHHETATPYIPAAVPAPAAPYPYPPMPSLPRYTPAQYGSRPTEQVPYYYTPQQPYAGPIMPFNPERLAAREEQYGTIGISESGHTLECAQDYLHRIWPSRYPAAPAR